MGEKILYFLFIKTFLMCNDIKGTKVRKLSSVFLTGGWHFSLEILALIWLMLDCRE